jgi:DNA polymerase I-like protein with 3'-5' exonuclease and polymerase domains
MVDRVINEEKLPARLMMSCHDEIGVTTDQIDDIRAIIIRHYTDFSSDSSPIKMRVPIRASGDFGPNWYEASK